MNAYKKDSLFFIALALVAIFIPEQEQLFCTFLTISTIYTVGGRLSDDIKRIINE